MLRMRKFLVALATLAMVWSTAPAMAANGFLGPNQKSCSQVASGGDFERIGPSSVDGRRVQTCHLSNLEEFWGRRHGVRDGYLYEVNGQVFRVKRISVSTSSRGNSGRVTCEECSELR